MGLFASILGHIGYAASFFVRLLFAILCVLTPNSDGNFHESILYNPINGDRQKVEDCVKRMVNRALDMDGTCTGEHSVGWGKKDSLLKEVGPDTLAVMRAIKAALDPYWIMYVSHPRIFCTGPVTD